MIRSWKLQSRIPRRHIEQSWGMRSSSGTSWKQFQSPALEHEEQWNVLKAWAIKQTKRKNYDISRWSMILHTIMYVPPHTDSMSKTTYVIPINVYNSTKLYEDCQEVPLKIGNIYSFNDFNTHGIGNEHNATLQLLTLEFE